MIVVIFGGSKFQASFNNVNNRYLWNANAENPNQIKTQLFRM